MFNRKHTTLNNSLAKWEDLKLAASEFSDHESQFDMPFNVTWRNVLGQYIEV